MSLPEHDTDIVGDGDALLIPEYQETPRWRALLASYLAPLQEIEDTIQDILTVRLDLESATGIELDVVGEIVGEPRDGRLDTPYRLALQVRVLVNRSHGSLPELIRIAKLFCDTEGEVGAYVWAQTVVPGTVEIFIVRTPVQDPVEVAKRLKAAALAGVRVATGTYSLDGPLIAGANLASAIDIQNIPGNVLRLADAALGGYPFDDIAHGLAGPEGEIGSDDFVPGGILGNVLY